MKHAKICPESSQVTTETIADKSVLYNVSLGLPGQCVSVTYPRPGQKNSLGLRDTKCIVSTE